MVALRSLPDLEVESRKRLAHSLRLCRGSISHGRSIHDELIRSSFERDVFLGSLIVGMYADSGAMQDAHSWFFSTLHHFDCLDVYTWNHIITGYVHQGQVEEALQLFKQMLHEGTPANQFIVATIFSACAHPNMQDHGQRLHACLIGCNLHVDIAIGNAIVNMYGKSNRLDKAQKAFDIMSERNTLSWTAIITVYAQNGEGKQALYLFNQMQRREGIVPNNATFASILCACAHDATLSTGKYLHGCIAAMGLESDITVANALINMYGKCGSMDDVHKNFDKMDSRSNTSWNALITVHIENNIFFHVTQLFNQMLLEAILPDRITYINVCFACAHQLSTLEAKKLHTYVIHSLYHSNTAVGNALLNAYAKCCALEHACELFLDILEPDEVSWSSLICSAANHGNSKLAFMLFNVMHKRGVLPNETTVLSILYVCSHLGMMDECFYYFISMSCCPVMVPFVDHYNCIIDLLARAGRLDDAKKCMDNMPYQPTLASWMTLLGACKNQPDWECGENAASHVFELQSENFASFTLLSNIYDAAIQHETLL